jgi:DNA mismatch repair protein MutH
LTDFLKPLSELPYNPLDLKSIMDYANLLLDKNLREMGIQEKPPKNIKKNKGDFGSYVEQGYFFIKQNNSKEPDFSEVSLELKTGRFAKATGKERKYKAILDGYLVKEDMALGTLNFKAIKNESFETSSFLTKNQQILFIYNIDSEDIHDIDKKIHLVDFFKFSDLDDYDKAKIQNEWGTIKSNIETKGANNLSQGDTEYLQAKTSGTGGQKNTPEKPKSRKLVFSKSFMQNYFENLEFQRAGKYKQKKRLFSSPTEARDLSLQDKILEKFSPYLGKSDKELFKIFTIDNLKSKQSHADLAKLITRYIFEIPEDTKEDEISSYVDEFSKANIKIKSVVLNKSSSPTQATSFPAFKWLDLCEQDWEISDLKNLFETTKFLFVFFQELNNGIILKKPVLWNMSNTDINRAKVVWEYTRKIVKQGIIVKGYETNKKNEIRRVTNLPGAILSKKLKSNVHVRPHTSKITDTNPLPVQDRYTKTYEYTNYSFWLNASYVKNEIFLK